MPTRFRVVIYDDSSVFGGHEVMTLLGLEGLLRAGAAVLFVYAAVNTKLGEALVKIQKSQPGLEISELAPPSRKLQGIRNHFEGAQIRALADVFRRFAPSVVLCAQGDLELSSRGLLAGKKAGLRTVSYIPFAHTQKEMGAKLGRFRDPFNAYLLAIPDAFITISQEAAAHFLRRGARAPVHVVYNGIDIQRFGGSKEEARRKYDLPPRGWVIALCGRLECVQKGQPLLLEAISRSPLLRTEVLTLFVGDGPDEKFLRGEVARLGLTERVRFTGWCDVADLYPALDAVVIASRFEGMPLVMLEALASNVPVVSTDRDGMKEVLPPAFRYPSGDSGALAKCLERILTDFPAREISQLNQKVRSEMSLEAFQKSFVMALQRQSEAGVR